MILFRIGILTTVVALAASIGAADARPRIGIVVGSDPTVDREERETTPTVPEREVQEVPRVIEVRPPRTVQEVEPTPRGAEGTRSAPGTGTPVDPAPRHAGPRLRAAPPAPTG